VGCWFHHPTPEGLLSRGKGAHLLPYEHQQWYNVHVSKDDAFTGLPIDIDEGQTRRWRALLVKTVFVILVVGVVLSATLWVVVSADVGALTLSAVFAASAGLLVLRQALLAERR
jgi:hypothetical protein